MTAVVVTVTLLVPAAILVVPADADITPLVVEVVSSMILSLVVLMTFAVIVFFTVKLPCSSTVTLPERISNPPRPLSCNFKVPNTLILAEPSSLSPWIDIRPVEILPVTPRSVTVVRPKTLRVPEIVASLSDIFARLSSAAVLATNGVGAGANTADAVELALILEMISSTF